MTLLSKKRSRMNDILITSDNALSISSENQIADTLRQLKELKEQEEAIKKKLIEEMGKRGIVKLETPKLSITYVGETTRESIDTKKLKEEQPDIYDEYCRISPVKESVRIKVNE